jgi:Fe-S-cluster containining protein
MCCRYLGLPIETPETREDFDLLRWYLSHENVVIYVEDGCWYLQANNRCRHLTAEHRCDIYARRPGICRDHSPRSCEHCEGDLPYELHFTNDAQMEAYMQAKFDNTAAESRRCRRGKGGRRDH